MSDRGIQVVLSSVYLDSDRSMPDTRAYAVRGAKISFADIV